MKNRIFYISWGAILALFALNIYIFNNKIKKINTKVDPYVTNDTVCLGQAETLANEVFHDYANKKIDVLKDGVDARSCEVLDYVLKCMEYVKFLKNARFESIKGISFPSYQLAHKQNWENEKKSIKKKYYLYGAGYCPEVFYFHHGLRFTNKKIPDYVRNKDMIDCGAFIGDSLLVMQKYTDKTVYCYEFSRKNVEKFAKVIKKNGITSGYKLLPMALGETVRRIKYFDPDTSCSGTMLFEGGNDTVEMTTIDEEVKKHNINVGFIKMDVEGYAMPIVKGAINTIKSQRPVLSLGIYHNNEELFRIKPFLQKHLIDYVYEFHLQQFQNGDFNEMILFCYPKELIEQNTQS